MLHPRDQRQPSLALVAAHSGASRSFAAIAVISILLLVTPAGAQVPQPAPDSWQYSVTVYALLPTIDGAVSFPAAGGSTTFQLNTQDILDHLKMTFMGSFGANYGRWGFFTDALYMNLGESKSGFRDFTIGSGRLAVPVTTTADVTLGLRSWIVTAAGTYRLPSTPGLTADALFGTRYLYVSQEATWTITGSIGANPPASASGSAEAGVNNWDAIVGLKGEIGLGGNGRWALPFYLDVGTGQSHLTWQAIGGVTYRFDWGQLGAVYRYLDYHLSSGGLQNLTVSGPMIGAVFRW